jgi:glycosyltransferase involved in cell wall biosynthesis
MSLTISIPTFNREKLLEKLHQQYDENNCKFDILICHNTSTNNTSLVVKIYLKNNV